MSIYTAPSYCSIEEAAAGGWVRGNISISCMSSVSHVCLQNRGICIMYGSSLSRGRLY